MALLKKDNPVPAANGMTLNAAMHVIIEARKKAEELGVMQNIAVVDEGGSLIAFVRMDGAWRGSIEIAMSKALTARNFDMTTEALGQIAQPGEMCFGIHVSNQGKPSFSAAAFRCKSAITS
jgi:uncharacterized protein GlcG (DUF336 family)